jgi:hypothetical protein
MRRLLEQAEKGYCRYALFIEPFVREAGFSGMMANEAVLAWKK